MTNMSHSARHERRRKIAAHVKTTADVAETAKEFGVGWHTVKNACREFGVRMPRSFYARRGSSFTILAALFDVERSYLDIATEFGVTKQRVGQVYAAALAAKVPGLPVRKPRYRP